MTPDSRSLSRLPRSRLAVGAVALALLPLTACGPEDGTTLQVLAAASLTDVLDELAATFEAEHDDVEVRLSVGSSTDLAEQAADGAPGDVLATADRESMDVAVAAGAATDPVLLARNRLVIVTPPGNPAGVATLGDLAGATWVRCADEAPCGRLAADVLSGVPAEPVSLEEDARATLDKVVSGEAEAGLVYRTDAVAAGDDVETVEIARTAGAEQGNDYLVATLDQSTGPALADDFVALLTGPEGRDVLAAAGFGLP